MAETVPGTGLRASKTLLTLAARKKLTPMAYNRAQYIESNDGRVRLQFLPEGKRSANIHAGLIVSKFNQPFGRFEGTLRDGDQVCELQNVSGFTEEHYAKW